MSNPFCQGLLRRSCVIYAKRLHYTSSPCSTSVPTKIIPKVQLLTRLTFAQCPSRVFSGIQPTGIPHLGNYLCAISQWVKMQQQYDSMLLSIVDLHSITIPQNSSELRQNILNMAACLIACGINPDTTILFQQSQVPYHTELAWILGCLCTIPRLKSLPQWKDKSKAIKDPSVGLFTYPILQSADILLYKASVVPVGEDQITHLEIARDLARAFNRTHSVLFPECQPHIATMSKVRSLKNPKSKMSKSDENAMSRIDLNDTAEDVQLKIKKAVTDSVSKQLSYDHDKRAGIANLIDIHCLLTDLKPEQVLVLCADYNKLMYKELVADVINERIQPINEEMNRLLSDKHHLNSMLRKGCEKASEIAEATMKEVKSHVGFR